MRVAVPYIGMRCPNILYKHLRACASTKVVTFVLSESKALQSWRKRPFTLQRASHLMHVPRVDDHPVARILYFGTLGVALGTIWHHWAPF